MHNSRPSKGRPDGLDLSPFPHLSEVTVLGIMPYSFRPKHLSMLSVLQDMLTSWNTPSSRTLSLWIKPSPSSSQSKRFYTKQNYLNFLGAIGRTIKTCTFSTFVFLSVRPRASLTMTKADVRPFPRYTSTWRYRRTRILRWRSWNARRSRGFQRRRKPKSLQSMPIRLVSASTYLFFDGRQ